MQKLIKRFFWVLLLACSWQNSFGFSYGGPINNAADNWQSPVIGYGLGGDLNAPKNIGEEYRRNIAVMYYAFDQNFLDYFGPEGATAVSGAYTVLNALTNLDNYTKPLNEFPVETRQQNYQAQALGLYDLKSFTLGAMMEQLGLADPVRYMWTLHDRDHIGTVACPANMYYLVVQRNFDSFSPSLTQLLYSPYVNNTLYTYQIFEICSGPNPLAQAVPFAVDPLADSYSPVAASPFNIGWGDYFTGLTRDDVAGLRSLMSTNNVNWETAAPGTVLISTNTTFSELFPVSDSNTGRFINGNFYGTSSYGALVSFAKTNDPAALQAQYPALQFTLVSNYWAFVNVTNTTSFFTIPVGAPIGSPPQLVVTHPVTTSYKEYFFYTFDNIITNIYKATSTATLKTIKVGPMNGAPIGSPSVTTVTTQTVTIKVPSGEFFILPPDSPCGLDIVSSKLVFTNYTTNVITTTVGSTNNVSTATNGTGNVSFTQLLITPYVSHVYVIHPVTCDPAPTGLLRGIGRTSYVRADYDSLIGQSWQPITNDYNMTLVTGSKSLTQHLRRVVTQPDFLFSATDLTSGPGALPVNAIYSRNLNFDQSNILPQEAGPGTIQPSTTITFNKNGPVYLNQSEDVLDGTPYFTQTPGGSTTSLFYEEYFVWASFDGTTNAPVVFPNGNSIENLQNQILVQVSPTTVADGHVDVDYTPTVTFTATGGAFTQPFTWSASGLPAGLTVSADGTLSGVPTQAGTFDFTLTLTDYLGKTVQWFYTITINNP